MITEKLILEIWFVITPIV